MDADREQAFAALAARRTPALLRTAYLLTGDHHAAQDLVQVALARTYERWHRLSDVGAGEEYVRRVMVTQAATSRRRRWWGEQATERLPETAIPDPSDGADTREVLRRALQALPPAQRAVLVLRFFEDLSEKQTADLLGCSPGTVKSRCSRGLDALRGVGLLDQLTEDGS